MGEPEMEDDFGDEFPAATPRARKRKKTKESSSESDKSSAKPSSGKKGEKPKEPAKSPPPAVVYGFVACVFIPILAFAIFMAVRQRKNQQGTADAFAAQIDPLLRAPQEGPPPPGKPGRFAELSIDDRALSPYHHSLWEDMRAATPAEADYIVQVHEIRTPLFKYTNGNQAIRVTQEVTVIDKATWKLMGRKTFVGKDPPGVSVGSNGDVLGTPDRQEVIGYYRSLAGMK
jgi:hypothetical protein